MWCWAVGGAESFLCETQLLSWSCDNTRAGVAKLVLGDVRVREVCLLDQLHVCNPLHICLLT